MYNITLHLEEPDRPTSGRASLIRPTGDMPIWAIVTVDGWRVALKFMNRDGVPICAEHRTIPDETTPENRYKPWESSGNVDAIPGNGLPATLIHDLALGRIENQIRQALANYDHPIWPGHRDAREGDIPDHYLEWLEITSRSGTDRDRTASPQRPGRPALSDEHLAEVALHYTIALANRLATTRYVEEQMKEGNEHLPVTQWVLKARQRGFLTPPPKKGQKGGTLTDQARATIQMYALASPKPGRQSDEGDRP
jgi:hypothetical protein